MKGYLIISTSYYIEVWEIEVLVIYPNSNPRGIYKTHKELVNYRRVKPVWWEPGRPTPTLSNPDKVYRNSTDRIALSREVLQEKLSRVMEEKRRGFDASEDVCRKNLTSYEEKVERAKESIRVVVKQRSEFDLIELDDVVRACTGETDVNS